MLREHVTIRVADPANDGPDILRLRELVYVTEQRRLERVEELAATSDKYERFATYFIAHADGAAVGVARVIVDSPLGLPCEAGVSLESVRVDNRLVEVGHCMTVPRLRTTGLGLSLMKEAFKFSVVQLNATHILVDFFSDNAASVRFHRSMGFRALGQPYRDPRFANSPESIVGILAVAEHARARGSRRSEVTGDRHS